MIDVNPGSREREGEGLRECRFCVREVDRESWDFEMLGSMRWPSSSSLDCLEAERSASPKFPKSDTLSIYETTLQKLRLGSRRTFDLSGVSSTTKEDKPEDEPLDSDCKPCRKQSIEENLSISNTVTGKQKQMNIEESMMSARMRI